MLSKSPDELTWDICMHSIVTPHHSWAEGMKTGANTCSMSAVYHV